MTMTRVSLVGVGMYIDSHLSCDRAAYTWAYVRGSRNDITNPYSVEVWPIRSNRHNCRDRTQYKPYHNLNHDHCIELLHFTGGMAISPRIDISKIIKSDLCYVIFGGRCYWRPDNCTSRIVFHRKIVYESSDDESY